MARATHDAEEIARALRHLRRRDLKMKDVIRRVGPFTLKLDRRHFPMLTRSIVAQQISTNVARVIWKRLHDLLDPEGFTAETLLRQKPEQLRAIGLSSQKTRYLQDLAEKITDGTIRFRSLNKASDEEIIETLTLVKGIGEWTAQMYLIFSLGRLDVFPWNDLGVRMALKRIYELPDLPDKKTSISLAEPWRPYASVASWYCWRHGDLPVE
ncbi:MAG: DNA-3-methyladenine glycosylase 2 family protein [Planctomycetales bacterium]